MRDSRPENRQPALPHFSQWIRRQNVASIVVIALPIALPIMRRSKASFVRLMASNDRCSLDERRFRYSAPAVILAKSFQKKIEEEPVQQEAVKPGRTGGGNS